MADSKITALTALTAADPANDMIPIVDVSDTPPASGNTKRISINNLLACSPSATLASATISGDLTVDTSTLKVDSANNRVGIGTATPGAFALVVAAASGNVMQFENTSDSSRGGRITNTGTAGTGKFGITTTSSGYSLSFGIDATEKMLLDTSGNFGIGVTPAGTGGCLQLKSGVTFPATQVASSDANTLDDYEEGTWTGTLKGSVSDPTTPVTATGRYTKIGRQVNVQIWFFGVNTTGASGEVSVAGLPFTNATGLTAVPGSASSSSLVTFTGTLVSQIGNGASIFELYSVNSNATATNATHNAGTSRSLALSSTYQVA